MGIPANHPAIAQAVASGLIPAAVAKPIARRKYRNRPCECDGERFDSERERDVWLGLRAALARGEIADLRRQVRFTLAVHGVWVCDYIADFTHETDGALVVTDAKGVRTKDYKIKARLMKAVHGIEIHEA